MSNAFAFLDTLVLDVPLMIADLMNLITNATKLDYVIKRLATVRVILMNICSLMMVTAST